MTHMRRKGLLIGGIGVAVALLVGIFYAAGLPPFGKKGEIDAEEVCPSLGNASQSHSALKAVLPDKDSYSFDDDIHPLTEISAADFSSTCFVDGGSGQLLVVKTEMLRGDSETDWATWVKGTVKSSQDTTPFTSGASAFASSRVAAIYVPCTVKPKTNISVAVDLKEPGDSDAAESRKGLITLAENTAKFAHQKARCSLPSEIAN
ncbi:hypothetical protein ABZS88_20330 [Streptomyces sp. NPDC005480]|uniref:hypothetical protein n=1 Tax=Streptomyces sp. NPDC005480 TaxID=3154880 RepID=UPI0033BA3027